VHLQTRSIPASKCISEFTRFQSPSASPNILDHCRHVHRQGAMVGGRRHRGNGGGWRTGSTYSADPSVDRYHLMSISSYHIMKINSIFTNFWSHSLFPRLRGSSMPLSTISSRQIAMLLEPELLVLMNSAWMPREVRWTVVGGLSAF
jgi:hypothetical protein